MVGARFSAPVRVELHAQSPSAPARHAKGDIYPLVSPLWPHSFHAPVVLAIAPQQHIPYDANWYRVMWWLPGTLRWWHCADLAWRMSHNHSGPV